MRLLFLFLTGWVLLLVVGCSRKTITSTTEVRDSIVTREVPRYVEVMVPGDTVAIIQYLECDPVTNLPKPIEVKSKSKRAKVSVAIDITGKLTAVGGCDSLKQVIQAMDKEIFRLRHESKKEKEVVTEFKTRRIDIWCRWISIIYILITIAVIIIKVKKLNPLMP